MKFLPKPIPDWRLAWRFASVQSAVLLALLSGLQAEVLPLVSPLFPAHVWPWVSGGLALTVVLLRLVAQPGLAADQSAELRQFQQRNDDFRHVIKSARMEREDQLGTMLFWGIASVLCLLVFLIVGLYKAAT